MKSERPLRVPQEFGMPYGNSNQRTLERQAARLVVAPAHVVDLTKQFDKNDAHEVTVYYFEVHRKDGQGFVRHAISAVEARFSRMADKLVGADADALVRARELARLAGTERLISDWIEKETARG